MGNLNILDWTIVGAYMVIVVAIGFAFTKRAGGSMEKFFLSGRSVPWWLAGVSIVASHFSASFPIKISSLVRIYGIHHNWLHWYTVPGIMIGAIFFAKLWRRAGIITDNQLQEFRYGGKPAAGLRLFHAVYSGIFMNSFWLAMSLIAMEKISVTIVPEIDPVTVIIVLSVIALSYSVLAGLYGVVATDFIQFIFATVGTGLLAVIILVKLGGPAELVRQVSELPGKEHVTAIVPPLPAVGASTDDMLTFVCFALYVGVLWSFHGAQAGYGVQRLMAAKNERHAMLSLISAAFLEHGLLFWLWITIGLGSLVILGVGFDDQAAYPEMAVQLLPVGLRGVFIASMLAALMSTVDTHLNFGSSYIVNDLYKRFLHRDATEKHYVLVSRVTMVLIMAVSILMWLKLMKGTRILDNFKMITMAFAGLGTVGMLKWYWWRVNAWSEISVMVASLACMMFLKFGIPEYKLTTDYYPIGLLITIVFSTCVWLPVTFLAKPVDMKHLLAFYERVRPAGPGWRPVAAASAVVSERNFSIYDLLAWLTAVAAVFFFSFGLGKLVLGHYALGSTMIGLSVASCTVMLRTISRKE